MPSITEICKGEHNMSNNLVILCLTPDETDKLEETFMFYQDEGPDGAGWKSQELKVLAEKIYTAVELAKI
jgi:hypothetical protein